LLRYQKYLGSKWAFGDAAEDEVRAEETEIDEDAIVDVVMLNWKVVLRGVRRD
jgi:hypothetical protein